VPKKEKNHQAQKKEVEKSPLSTCRVVLKTNNWAATPGTQS
jgi:hypothetical protein